MTSASGSTADEEQNRASFEATKRALELLGDDFDAAVGLLAGAYATDVVFRDPLQTLTGREAFLEMNRRLYARARRLRFELIDAAYAHGQGFLTWQVDFLPRVGIRHIRFEGATQLKLRSGRVAYHRDYWDLAGAAAEIVPGVGGIYRALIRHLG